MAIPVLFDTDMGVDDAAALLLAMSSPRLDVRAIVATGGNVPLPQAEANVGRLLTALRPSTWPAVGRGLDQTGLLTRAQHVHGADGLGGADLPIAASMAVRPFLDVYRETVAKAAGALQIVVIGPLTTLAAALADSEIAAGIAHIHVMGGAVWCKGNVTPFAEFNFHCDPAAAARVLSCGRPVTLTPLDVTRHVTIDESHVAHLAKSGSASAEILSRILGGGLRFRTDGEGRIIVHDAVTVGRILWPELFARTLMQLEVVTEGERAGQCRPRLGGERQSQAEVLTAVKSVDLLENMLECLCGEAFVV